MMRQRKTARTPSGVEPKDGRKREQDDDEAERRPMPGMWWRRRGNLFDPVQACSRSADRDARTAPTADGVPGAAMADRKARAALAKI
jgi:hypothetical protein